MLKEKVEDNLSDVFDDFHADLLVAHAYLVKKSTAAVIVQALRRRSSELPESGRNRTCGGNNFACARANARG